MKKIILIVIPVAIIAALIAWKSRPEQLLLSASKIDTGTVEQSVSNTRAGTIKACRRSKLSTPMGGVVDKLLVKKGDTVNAGQLILELWSRDHHAALDQAKAALTAAQHTKEQMCLLSKRSKRESQRANTLLEKGLIATDSADNIESNAQAQNSACASAQSQIAAAQAQVNMQEAILERYQLRAPFKGVIAEINGEIGEYVTPSPPGVLTPPAIDIIDDSCLYATAPIDEVDAAGLKTGMPVKITLDAFRNKSFNGKLTRIAPYVMDLEKQARTVDVDVKFDQVPNDVTLLIGYSADVTIIINKKDKVLRIPSESLIDTDHVWLMVKDDKKNEYHLEKRKISLGIGNYTFTEVLSGLKENDLVVRSPDQTGIAEGITAQAKLE